MEGLIAAGVRTIFGNPGTTELPLLDSLADYPQLQYYLALHEGVAVGMGDAYALATGKLGVVNLHVAPGLGNGLGMLVNAKEGHSPVLITAGQQDTRMRLRDPLLSGDLVAMAAPLTKWSAQIERAEEIPLMLHRAVKTALEPPRGPVFLSLPINVMEEETSAAPLPPPEGYTAGRPDAGAVDDAAERLLDAHNPVIVCGQGVFHAAAQGELVSISELLGAPVWNTVLPATVNFPTSHPHYQGELPGDYGRIRQALGPADALLMVGGEFFKEIFHAPGLPFADDTILIQIEESPQALARNFALHTGIVAGLRDALQALREALLFNASVDYHAAAQARGEKLVAHKADERKKQEQRLRKNWQRDPMATVRFMWELKEALPPDAVVVSEAITGNVDLQRMVPIERAGDYYGSRGGGIGQGLPGALGFQLAHPDRPVVAVSGDGSSLYSIQALWTAAHHEIPVLFVILNNSTYRILKINMDRYRSEFGVGGERGYPHMDLTGPEVNYVKVAQGLGVPARRITKPEQVGPAVRRALKSGGPQLLDIVVDGTWPPRR